MDKITVLNLEMYMPLDVNQSDDSISSDDSQKKENLEVVGAGNKLEISEEIIDIPRIEVTSQLPDLPLPLSAPWILPIPDLFFNCFQFLSVSDLIILTFVNKYLRKQTGLYSRCRVMC